MCPPSVKKPSIDTTPDPKIADDQLALATRISDETRRRRLSAYRESLNPVGPQGVLSSATTTRTISSRGV